MTLFIWSVIFVASLIVMVKGSDWLLSSAEKIGVAVGLSPFIVGVLLVGIGTSFPELISSIVAVLQGVTEIVAANAIGSNIANILLVIGLASIVSGRLVVSKNLIDLDLPLVALSTALLFILVSDGVVTRPESIFLVFGYVVYFMYILSEEKPKADSTTDDIVEVIDDAYDDVTGPTIGKTILAAPTHIFKEIGMLIFGAAALALGAKYLIDSVIALSEIFAISPGVISLAAVAFGTSLPEILVSVKAAFAGKSEVAVGNIFGSNVFNILAVIGIPGLFTAISVDEQTLTLGLPVLIIATSLFVISGISKQIHNWEGWMYITIYCVFILKLFGIL